MINYDQSHSALALGPWGCDRARDQAGQPTPLLDVQEAPSHKLTGLDFD
jgi:hypothetical protein